MKNMDAQNTSSVRPSRNIRKPEKRIKMHRKGYFHRQLHIYRKNRALKNCISERRQNKQTENMLDAMIDCLKTLKRRRDMIDKLENNHKNWERAFDHMDSAVQRLEQELDVLISRRETRHISKSRSSG